METHYNSKWSYLVEEARHNEVEVITCYLNQNGTKVDFSVALSYHALSRCQERKLTKEIIALALICSTVIPKQGVLFHVVSPKLIPFHLSFQQKQKLKDLVVLTDSACSCIITAYYPSNAMRKTNKKRKSHFEQLTATYLQQLSKSS